MTLHGANRVQARACYGLRLELGNAIYTAKPPGAITSPASRGALCCPRGTDTLWPVTAARQGRLKSPQNCANVTPISLPSPINRMLCDQNGGSPWT